MNPILIVAFVPVFDYLIYPLFAKCGLIKKLLTRMSIGMSLTVAAFLVSALLEYNMQSAAASQNLSNKIKLVNLSPCRFDITSNDQKDTYGKLNILASEYKNNQAYTLPSQWSELSDRTFRVAGSCNVATETFNIDHDIAIDIKNLPKNVLLSLDTVNKKLVTSELPYELQEYGFIFFQKIFCYMKKF